MYRTSSRCHILWCIEGANHKGDHWGEHTNIRNGGGSSQRNAPNHTSNSDGMICTIIHLTPAQRKALNLGVAKLPTYRKPFWQRVKSFLYKVLFIATET